MNIGIIGLGSTGLLLSALLRKQGHDVTCYVRRQEQQQLLNKKGIHLLPSQHTFYINVEKLANLKDHDLYIVCVKQPQLLAVVNNMEKKISSNKPIVFLQNGMSHIDRVKLLKHPVYIGVLDHGAKRVNDYTVEHTGKGKIRIGSLKHEHVPMLNHIVKSLSSNDFPVHIEKNWEQIVKEKLIVNAVINPLTALLNVKNGEILSNAHINKLAQKLCRETCEVLDADKDSMWKYVKEVAEKTAENSSSMLQDIRLQKETEIDAITGYILLKSNKNIPNTEFIYFAVKAIEGGEIFD